MSSVPTKINFLWDLDWDKDLRSGSGIWIKVSSLDQCEQRPDENRFLMGSGSGIWIWDLGSGIWIWDLEFGIWIWDFDFDFDFDNDRLFLRRRVG